MPSCLGPGPGWAEPRVLGSRVFSLLLPGEGTLPGVRWVWLRWVQGTVHIGELGGVENTGYPVIFAASLDLKG